MRDIMRDIMRKKSGFASKKRTSLFLLASIDRAQEALALKDHTSRTRQRPFRTTRRRWFTHRTNVMVERGKRNVDHRREMYFVFKKLYRWCGAGIYKTGRSNSRSRATAAKELGINFSIKEGHPLYVGRTYSDFVDCLLRTIGGESVEEGADASKVITRLHVLRPDAQKGYYTYTINEKEMCKFGVGKKELKNFFKKIPHANSTCTAQALVTDHLCVNVTTKATTTRASSTEAIRTKVTKNKAIETAATATEVIETEATETKFTAMETAFQTQNLVVATLASRALLAEARCHELQAKLDSAHADEKVDGFFHSIYKSISATCDRA